MQGPLTAGRLSLILVCACLQADCVAGQRLALPSGNGRISGRVLSSSSEPIEGAMVTLMEHGASGREWPPPPRISDRNGTYVFDRLRPGRYSIFVEEISIRKRGYSTTRYSPGEFEVTSRSLDLAPGGDATQFDL